MNHDDSKIDTENSDDYYYYCAETSDDTTTETTDDTSSETANDTSSVDSVNADFTLDANEHSCLTETIHSLIYDILTDNPMSFSKPQFNEWLSSNVSELLIDDWINGKLISEQCDTDEINNTIDDIIYDFLDNNENNIPNRSLYDTHVPSVLKHEFIDHQLAYLTALPQPEQKTDEWYNFRHNLVTASNIWKIFASNAQRNSIMYEKCKPLNNGDVSKSNNWHSTGSLQWGVLYEAVSILLYEHLYKTKVSDFGCIQHPKYKCIGASPDGINTDPSSPLYGRMLEIKNIVNRDITGIPKEDYWIQMQVQMETCNLDECDFVETRFKEYENDDDMFSETDLRQKGIILCFIETGISDSKPTYIYSPIDMTFTRETVNKWVANEYVELGPKYEYHYRKCWYLDQISCVLVQRNRMWFNAAVPIVLETWKEILKERVNGYEHRAPKKRQLSGPCIFISNDDTVTTTRTIHNLKANAPISVVRINS